mgnify:CR=1 FL=1|jgi:hypothetical protein
MRKTKVINFRLSESQKQFLIDKSMKDGKKLSATLQKIIQDYEKSISLECHVKDKQYQTLDGVV